jgi:hypothetical protein
MLALETFGVPLFGGFQAERQHVENDAYVDRYYQQAKQIWPPAQEIGYFEGDIN